MNNRFDSTQLYEGNHGALMLSCADQVGVIASVTSFFSERGISLTDCSEFIHGDYLFLRVQWTLDDQWEDASSFSKDFSTIADKLAADYNVKFCDRRHSVGLFVADETEVLLGILNQTASNAFRGLDIAFIIACDPSVSNVADRYGLPFFLVEQNEGVVTQDRRLLDVIQRYKCDFLGLAQFPYKLPTELVEKCACPIIQTAPMPLLLGEPKSSYLVAFEKGAKLLGASSFLLASGAGVNSDGGIEDVVMGGPVVHQIISSIRNGSSAADLSALGAALEQEVFTKTLMAVLEHRVLNLGSNAIVFD